MSEIERTIEHVRRRDWEKIRAFWIDRLALVDNFNSESSIGIGDILEVDSVASRLATQRRGADEWYRATMQKYDFEQITKPRKEKVGEEQLRVERRRFENNTDRTRFQKCPPIEETINELSPAMFGEGIRLLHKAVHVLGCAEKEAHHGMRSWSLCSGYQSSLFAAKALIALCGVGWTEFQSKTVLCDLFPEPVARSEDYLFARFHFIPRRLDHRDIWIIVRRLLAVTFCDLWPSEVIDTLKSMEEKLFAKQRNDIQYKNRFWPLPDLFHFVTQGPFGGLSSWRDSRELDPEREDFSLISAFYFVRLASALAADVSGLSNKLKSDMDALNGSVNSERHPIYFATLMAEGL